MKNIFNTNNTKTELEIQLLKESSLLVGKTLAEVARHLKVGVTTKYLDEIAESFILNHGAKPSFKGYEGFPASLCISVNDRVVHGIPNNYVIKNGDIVSIDCGVEKNGYHGDYAYTFAVGDVKKEYLELLHRTKESLYKGIEMAIDGNTVGDIGFAIQNYVESYGFSVVRELVGHGIGRNLHEKPEVPNYGQAKKGARLKEGMVICIEPMINFGKKFILFENDGWTVRTADGKPSAHFEHQIVVRKDKAEIISTYEFIEQIIN